MTGAMISIIDTKVTNTKVPTPMSLKSRGECK